MIHILGNKQKREIFIHLGKKNLSLFPAQLHSRTLSFSLPGLHSPCYHYRLHSASSVWWWVVQEGSEHRSLSQLLSASHPSHLFLLLQRGSSMGSSPFGGAPVPAWAHLWATVPLLWSTSFCSAVVLPFGSPVFLLSIFLPFLKYVFVEMPPGWLMGSAASCSGCVVELAGVCCVEHRAAPGLHSQRPSPKPPSTKTLAWTPNKTAKCKKETNDLKHLE